MRKIAIFLLFVLALPTVSWAQSPEPVSSLTAATDVLDTDLFYMVCMTCGAPKGRKVTGSTMRAELIAALNQVLDPTADKTFLMTSNMIQFSFTNPVPAGAFEGAFDIEATGNFGSGSGDQDLVHIHQHTGNPGTMFGVHIQTEDPDAFPLKVVGFHSSGLAVQVDDGIETASRLQFGSVTAASAVCLHFNSDRIYHDTDCDETQDAGEEYIDEVAGTPDHGSLTGLGDDDHTQYLYLAGRATGQTATGGTETEDKLTLYGNSFDANTGGLVLGKDSARLTADDSLAADALEVGLTGTTVTMSATTDAFAVVSGTEKARIDGDGVIGTDSRLRVGQSDSDANSACVSSSSDHLYHDTDCDGTKDAGEEFIDQTGGAVDIDSVTGQTAWDTAATKTTADLTFDGVEADFEAGTGEGFPRLAQSTTPPSTACDAAAEVGRIYYDADATDTIAGGICTCDSNGEGGYVWDCAMGGTTGLILDLGDDGSNEATNTIELATTKDDYAVVTNPSAGKALFDFGKVPPYQQYDPDRRPGSCAYCDEFLGDDDQLTWSWGNQGTATITYQQDAAFLDIPAGAGENLRVRWITGADGSATDWVATMKVGMLTKAASNWIGVALLAAGTEGTPTAIRSCAIVEDSSTMIDFDLVHVIHTNYTTWSSNPTTVDSGFGGTGPYWVRMRYVSSTKALTCGFSSDGIAFYEGVSQTLLAHPTTSIGFVANAVNASVAPQLAVYYFRQRTDSGGTTAPYPSGS